MSAISRLPLVNIVLCFIALYGSWLSFKYFESDARYANLKLQKSSLEASYIDGEALFPTHDVRFSMLKYNLADLPTGDFSDDARVVRELRITASKELINADFVASLVQHQLNGFFLGYPNDLLIGSSFSLSNGRFVHFENAFELALRSFYEIPPALRLRAIILCNNIYSRLPWQIQDRIIRNILENSVAWTVYNNSYNEDLLKDLYPFRYD